MVGIAQSVERLVVVQEVAGSSPVTHPAQIGMNMKKFMPIFLYFQHSSKLAVQESLITQLEQAIKKSWGSSSNRQTPGSRYCLGCALIAGNQSPDNQEDQRPTNC